MRLNTIVFKSISIIIGFVFLFSAYVKLFPIEILEIAVVETGIIGWSLAPIMARLLIASEFVLGLFLIMNIKPKLVSALTALSLIVFTIYLTAILIFQGKDVNCNCFGLYMVMNPIESIIKNIVLLLFVILVYFKNKAIKYPKEWIFLALGTLIPTAIPFIVNPPTFDKSKYEYIVEEPYLLDLSIVYSDLEVEQPKLDLRKGKHLIAFYSYSCQHCVVAAYNLQLIAQRNPDLSFYFFINGDENDLKTFHNLTKSEHVPHSILLAKPLLMLAGNSLPAILLVNNSFVEDKIHPHGIDENKIQEWFLKK
jgi:uncharacterized membrane protein YphA (DoxX/SURF4 family)